MQAGSVRLEQEVEIMAVKYKRILLKLSGEALAGEKGFGLDYEVIRSVCRSIKDCADLGVEIGIVVGGGNFWRGRSSGSMDRTRADHIGMLGTTMNALAVADVLEELGCTVRVQTAIIMQQIAEPYIRNKAVRHLEKAAWLFSDAVREARSFRRIQRLRSARRKLRRKSFLKPPWWMGSMTRIRTSSRMP